MFQLLRNSTANIASLLRSYETTTEVSYPRLPIRSKLSKLRGSSRSATDVDDSEWLLCPW